MEQFREQERERGAREKGVREQAVGLPPPRRCWRLCGLCSGSAESARHGRMWVLSSSWLWCDQNAIFSSILNSSFGEIGRNHPAACGAKLCSNHVRFLPPMRDLRAARRRFPPASSKKTTTVTINDPILHSSLIQSTICNQNGDTTANHLPFFEALRARRLFGAMATTKPLEDTGKL